MADAPSEPTVSDAFAPTAPGDATEAEALRGLEVRRLEARVREALFGRIAEPVRIGRFVVLERIGEGGMGVVYSAYDDALERKVAIKLVRPQLESDDGQRRIRREAQAAARLSHPNVVTVYEIGEHAGRVFVAMEFVRGRTLRQWLAAAPRPWQGIVDVFVDAGRGLQAAHAAGLVHRDFKPDNVMIDDDEDGGRGRVRVLDFGVARRVGAASAATGGVASTESEVTGTDAGRIVGTPAYMAPEQLAGELADARSDQYAFCLSLWLALFGESPFEDDAARRTGLVRSPSRPHRVPARVRSVLERGLAFRAEDRHSSMQAVIAGLVAARRRRWRWAAAAAATLICGIAIAGWWRRAPSECERAAAQLDDVWSDAARGRIAARVGPDAWSSVEPALAAHVEAWREAHAAACRDAVDGPDALQQRRCLAADAEAVRGVLAALEGSGLEAEAGALAAVRGWESPESCLEPDALRRWADRQALMDAPPPVGSEDGLVSDFDAEPMVRFGFGWVRSTDALIEGESEAALTVEAPGVHGSAGALVVTGEVRARLGPTWAGAMYFPGPQAMTPANLTTMPMLSFWIRGTPGRYGVALFTVSKEWDGAELEFDVGDEWQRVEVDLRQFGAGLFDVTGIFVGRSVPGGFRCVIDEVRLDGGGR